MTDFKSSIAFAVAVLMVLVGTSCGNDSVARSERPQERHLRIALSREPAAYDPHLHGCATARAVLCHIYEELLALDDRMRPIPGLAENWETPTATSWRFHLRKDARFHDGRPVDSAAVIFSIDRARNHPSSQHGGWLVAIHEVKAIDSHTVEVLTRYPYPILPKKLAQVPIVPQDSPEQITFPIGSGPYRTVKISQNSVDLELVPGFKVTGRRRPARRLSIYFISSTEERTRGLLDGRFDIVDNLRPPFIARVEAREDLRIESIARRAVVFFYFDHSRPPWSDLRLRRALDLLVDRERLVAAILGGRGEPIGQLVTNLSQGFHPDLQPSRMDLVAARRLLVEAGYPQGLEIDLQHQEGLQLEPIRRQLEEGGFKVNLIPVRWPILYQRLVKNEVPLSLLQITEPTGDASSLFDQILHSHDPKNGWGVRNWNHYSNPELDRLIELSQKVSHPLERGALMKEAMALALADLALVPLYTSESVFGLRRELEWSPRHDGRIQGFEIYWQSDEEDRK